MLRASDLHDLPVVHAHGGKLSAPYTTRIQTNHIGPDEQPQRRPMAKHHRHVLRHAIRHIEPGHQAGAVRRSEEHTSELQSLMRNSYAVFCLKKKNTTQQIVNLK